MPAGGEFFRYFSIKKPIPKQFLYSFVLNTGLFRLRNDGFRYEETSKITHCTYLDNIQPMFAVVLSFYQER